MFWDGAVGLTPKRIKEVRGLAWEQPEGAAGGVETGLGCLQEAHCCVLLCSYDNDSLNTYYMLDVVFLMIRTQW